MTTALTITINKNSLFPLSHIPYACDVYVGMCVCIVACVHVRVLVTAKAQLLERTSRK